MDTKEKMAKDSQWKKRKRFKCIMIYLTPAEYEFLQASALQTGLPFPAFIRGLALQGQVNSRLNEEEKAFFRNLVSMANDLHRLGMRAREKELPEMMSCFETCRDLLAPLLKKLKL